MPVDPFLTPILPSTPLLLLLSNSSVLNWALVAPPSLTSSSLKRTMVEWRNKSTMMTFIAKLSYVPAVRW